MPRPFILRTAAVTCGWKLDYKTENKMHVDSKYKWEKMAVTLISTSACYQVPRQTDENWVSARRLVSVSWFVFGKWRHVSCSDRFRLFVNVSTFPYYNVMAFFLVSEACVCHVFLISSDFAELHVLFWGALFVDLFLLLFSQIWRCAPSVQMHLVICKLHYLTHFQIGRGVKGT